MKRLCAGLCVAVILLGIHRPESRGQPETQSLPLPSNFNPETNLLAHEVDGQLFHQPRASVRYCEALLANGTPKDIALAEKMLPGVFSGQIRDPSHPHFGAFKWELEMEQVEDLNAVQFVLYSLVSIGLLHEDKLSPPIVDELKKSIGLGLENIARVDVGLPYSNIVLKDIANSCLGGEYLGDERFAQRGYEKLQRWMAYTDRSGHPYEYNSLPYTAVCLDVLSRLHRYVEDGETKVRAKLALTRLGISAGLHMHGPTNRWAGPHSRAYHGSVVGSGGSYRLKESERQSYGDWIDRGEIPSWMRAFLDQETLPDQVVETTGRDDGIAISTYKDKAYSFGVATRGLANQDNRYIAWQSNVFTIHYDRGDGVLPGALYTRYLLDDNWLGYFSAGVGRGNSYLLPDVGHFQGVQDRERAIGLYIPQSLGASEHHSSAKSVVAIPRWDFENDIVWADGGAVRSFPCIVEGKGSIVFETGKVMIGVKPLTLTNLDVENPIRLDRKDDTLVLELYNYQGALKTFWELTWPGAFFQGHPRNGFYSEVAERGDHASGLAFAKLIDSGEIIDVAEPRQTYTGSETRKWKVEYRRDGRRLGLEVDLFDWLGPSRRWNESGDLGWPMLQSERAIQTRGGSAEIGPVSASSEHAAPILLYVSPDESTIVASCHGTEPSTFALRTPGGRVDIDRWRSGLIVIENGEVSIDAIDLQGSPRIEGLKLARVFSSGQ